MVFVCCSIWRKSTHPHIQFDFKTNLFVTGFRLLALGSNSGSFPMDSRCRAEGNAPSSVDKNPLYMCRFHVDSHTSQEEVLQKIANDMLKWHSYHRRFSPLQLEQFYGESS